MSKAVKQDLHILASPKNPNTLSQQTRQHMHGGKKAGSIILSRVVN
jgi:hypothetical protein